MAPVTGGVKRKKRAGAGGMTIHHGLMKASPDPASSGKPYAELVLKVAAAFARYCKYGTVVVGRDSRITGEAIAGMTESRWRARVRCGGPGNSADSDRPGMVEHAGAAGGIVVSASHNPIEWNAFSLSVIGLIPGAEGDRQFFALMSASINRKNGIPGKDDVARHAADIYREGAQNRRCR